MLWLYNDKTRDVAKPTRSQDVVILLNFLIIYSSDSYTFQNKQAITFCGWSHYLDTETSMISSIKVKVNKSVDQTTIFLVHLNPKFRESGLLQQQHQKNKHQQIQSISALYSTLFISLYWFVPNYLDTGCLICTYFPYRDALLITLCFIVRGMDNWKI